MLEIAPGRAGKAGGEGRQERPAGKAGGEGRRGRPAGKAGGAEACLFSLPDFLLSGNIARIGRFLTHSGEKIDILY